MAEPLLMEEEEEDNDNDDEEKEEEDNYNNEKGENDNDDSNSQIRVSLSRFTRLKLTRLWRTSNFHFYYCWFCSAIANFQLGCEIGLMDEE